jgi:hypothetical protein
MSDTYIEIDEKIVERLKRNIIIRENINLKTREKSDAEMVKWIKSKIEEEVQCCLNQ